MECFLAEHKKGFLCTWQQEWHNSEARFTPGKLVFRMIVCTLG